MKTTKSDRLRALVNTRDLLNKLIDDWPTADQRITEWAHGLKSASGDRGPIGGVSNPTAAAALMQDKFGRERADLYATVDRLWHYAANADRIRHMVMDDVVPPLPQERGAVSCANAHGCPDDNWADKAGRCRTCYEYMRRTGRDRRESRS